MVVGVNTLIIRVMVAEGVAFGSSSFSPLSSSASQRTCCDNEAQTEGERMLPLLFVGM